LKICKFEREVSDEILGKKQIVLLWEVGKGKAIPLQTLTGPEGSRRLGLPDFKIIGT
jgi:hypothetical protein